MGLLKRLLQYRGDHGEIPRRFPEIVCEDRAGETFASRQRLSGARCAKLRSGAESAHSREDNEGCQPMYRTRDASTGPVLVHSTDLRSSRVYLNGCRGISEERRLYGPSVLLPRVGRITKDKIALLQSLDTPIVLSDCVIAITTTTLDDARRVQKLLIEGFPSLRAQYVGTGAPFVTLQRLRTVLNRLGIACDDGN